MHSMGPCCAVCDPGFAYDRQLCRLAVALALALSVAHNTRHTGISPTAVIAEATALLKRVQLRKRGPTVHAGSRPRQWTYPETQCLGEPCESEQGRRVFAR